MVPLDKYLKEPVLFSDELLVELDPDPYSRGFSTIINRVKSIVWG